MTLAGWVNRGQQDVIEYLQEENRVLRKHIGGRRLLFTDAQRRCLAIKAKKVSRKALTGIEPIVTPDTLLRWYRNLVARKYDGSKVRKAGRPRTAADIERLVIRMARENLATRSEGLYAIWVMSSAGTRSSESSWRTALNRPRFVGRACRGRPF
jgi:hypothetical protein